MEEYKTAKGEEESSDDGANKHPKRPRGRTPNGKIWVDGYGYVNDPEYQEKSQAQEKKRPRGRAPKGKVWDNKLGDWADEP